MGVSDKKQIEEIRLTEGMVKRVSTVRIECIGSEKLITAWQCSMIDMVSATIKLYSILEITLDENGIVTKANLSEDFKGSQGPFCRPECLNRLAKKCLIGMSFKSDNSVFKDKNMFACRHVFELVSAAVTFYRYCDFSSGQKEFSFTDTIWGNSTTAGIINTENHFVLNGDDYRFHNDIAYEPNSVIIDNSGRFVDIRNMKMHFLFTKNDESLFDSSAEVSDLHDDITVKNRLMRIFVSLWNKTGKLCGVDKNFYFTNLQPIAYSGMILEALVRVIRADNPAAFGGLLRALQHAGEKPLCLGMAVTEEELDKYFTFVKNI